LVERAISAELNPAQRNKTVTASAPPFVGLTHEAGLL